jgi:L-iditol 2-dehydrogenase
MTSTMTAALLTAPSTLELRRVPLPALEPHQVRVRMAAVGICGTDRHIYRGSANYHCDGLGKPIPFEAEPQILGHELSGVVEEVGAEVADLARGDRVLVDQGLTCRGKRLAPECEYCASGDSHQCLNYSELGITGLPGGFAEYLTAPAVNAVRVEGDLGPEEIALAEPLGCVLHATETAERAAARYTFTGPRRIGTILVLGAGPAGLLFIQYFRNIRRFDGRLLVAERNPRKLELAAAFGAAPVGAADADLVPEVIERTRGEKVHLVVDATGAGSVFRLIPGLLRKQGTLVLYGHGHEGVDMSLLNSVQFLEPTLVSPAGASGGFDGDGRPLVYRRALGHILAGRVRVAQLVTERCGLERLTEVFEHTWERPDFVKAVVIPGS